MSKYKPNEPCYCGSGKKSKKCHGAKLLDIPVQSSKPIQDNSQKLEGTLGLSGMEIGLSLMRLNNKNPNAQMNSALPSGKKGFYKVEFILSRPNRLTLAENHISFDINTIDGDSHIFIGTDTNAKSVFQVNLKDENIEFYGYPNSKGKLSKIVFEKIEALGFQDAMTLAYNALCPTLSRISLLADVPLNVSNTLITELSTNNLMSQLTLPYVEKFVLLSNNDCLNKDTSKFVSLYREALNSNSPNYQFLCFYKIVEGIRKIRKEKTDVENQTVLAQGRKPTRIPEFIPKDIKEQIEWLNFIFVPQRWSEMAIGQVFINEVAGLKLNSVIMPNSELDMVRNRIAHAAGLRDETKETYNFDNGLHIAEVHKWLPFCKCIAIYLLKKDFPEIFQ